MTKDEIKTRTRAALAKALKVAPETITDNASQMDFSGWDSVRHMNVVLSLENEFGIQFEDADLPTLTSLPLMVAAVEKLVYLEKISGSRTAGANLPVVPKMKILFHSHTPFLLAHGGAQIQIEQTKAALEEIGVAVEYLRWHDGSQTGDVMHFFGRIPTGLLNLAHQKGMKVVMAELLTGQGSRSPARLRFQKMVSQTLKHALPRLLTDSFNWDAYRLADACIANTVLEKNIMELLFDAPPEKIHVVPNGVEDIFFNSPRVERGPWLVCTATITDRKRVLELAQAAVVAQTPIWIVGKAYSESDAYARRFMEFARQNPKLVRYEGPVNDRKTMAGIYRAARGFVLLSTKETRSLSSEEAAACECPLLLSDLPWARSVFQDQVSYCAVTGSPAEIAPTLKSFYDKAPTLPPPSRPKSWVEVARQFQSVYEQVLKSPK